MRSSRSKRSTTSPIAEVPYDVLMEIFIHCLPRYPLEIRQPDITAAPMLLCQICSSWRTVALTSPTLWSHLSYFFTVADLGFTSCEFLQNEIEFLRWWKKNQGPMAPFLRLELNYDDFDDPNQTQELLPLARDGLAFFLEYISSAQYLQTDPIIWKIVHNTVKDDHQFIFPNLHTLATSNLWNDTWESHFHDAQVLIGLTPNPPPFVLRRLSIYKEYLQPDEENLSIIIPTHWFTLTHLSLCGVRTFFNFWFAFIRAVPDLQWAFINIHDINGITNYTNPTNHIIPRLSTLFVDANIWSSREILDFLPGVLLIGLHLPALHTISMSYSKMSHHHIPAIRTILQSTPVITTLTLRGYDFLFEREHHTEILGAVGGITPIWADTPHLKDVHLALPNIRDCTNAEMAERLDIFVRNAFFSDMNLIYMDNPTCPIRTITLIDMNWRNLRFNEVKDLTIASIRKHTRGSSNTIFKFIPYSEDVSAAGSWKEWGSKD